MANVTTPQIDWNMVEAIGSIGAVVVALALVISGSFIKWWRRPRITIEICTAPVEIEYPEYPGKDHRLRIRNKGRTTAKNVTVKIKEIIYKDPKAKDQNLYFLSPSLVENESLQWEDYHSFTALLTDDVYDALLVPGKKMEFLRADCSVTFLITGDNFHGFESKWDYIDSNNLFEVELRKRHN